MGRGFEEKKQNQKKGFILKNDAGGDDQMFLFCFIWPYLWHQKRPAKLYFFLQAQFVYFLPNAMEENIILYKFFREI